MADLATTLTGGGLGCVYFALLLIGILYALVILVTGGTDDATGAADLGGDVDVAGPDTLQGAIDVTHVSPVTIAGFVTAFGAFGIISQSLFHASPGMSLVWATLGGLIVGVASHVAFIYLLLKPQGSSEVTRGDIVGARAEVITPIPAGNVGEVALVAQGARVTMTARAADGGGVARGTVVAIVEQVGNVVLVEPVPPTAAVSSPGAAAGPAPRR
jgi:hypothetical protein